MDLNGSTGADGERRSYSGISSNFLNGGLYETLRNLNSNGIWECPYIRSPRFTGKGFLGNCALLDFSPCAYPQFFNNETRFNLPCIVYQEFIKRRQISLKNEQIKAQRPKPGSKSSKKALEQI